MDSQTKNKLEDIEHFLKTAFCIDGDCKFKESVSIISPNGTVSTGQKFELTDSNRGVFYITMST